MTEQPTAPKAPAQEGIGSLISLSAIIVAALVAATTALIRPYLENSTESTLLVAVFLSVTTTTSNSIYTACVGKVGKYTACVGEITKVYGGRRWRSILFAGLLAGLAACLLGIVGTSGVELAMGKEPSISENGTQVIPISTLSALGEEPSISPDGTQDSPISPPPIPPLISYYYDSDGDKLGSGNPVKYERGSQPFGWVEQSGDKCPDSPGSLDFEGCPPPGLLVWYFSDVDHDLIGDTIEIGSPTKYQRGFQPFGWVEQSGDNCPFVPNANQRDNDRDGQGDACENEDFREPR